MLSSSHCVGIAAVQVGVLLRIVLVDISLNPKPHHNNGFLVMINPKITYMSGKLKSREGCLSVPDFTGNVVRKNKIEVEYLDINGNKQLLKTHGFESITVQHEIDHLDGFIFLDTIRISMRSISRKGCSEAIMPKSTLPCSLRTISVSYSI